MSEDDRGRSAPHAEIPVPHDLQIELHDDPEAAAAFAALPPSHRREYIDWILEAKRPETRMRRVEDTARRVKASKGRGAPRPQRQAVTTSSRDDQCLGSAQSQGSRSSSRTAPTTSSGWTPLRHRWWPSGQTSSWHQRQGTSCDSTRDGASHGLCWGVVSA